MVPAIDVATKYRKMVLKQQQEAWDPDTDLDWNSFDSRFGLFPMSSYFIRALALSDDEARTLSQLIGVMAAQAIAQHEFVLASARQLCWESPADSKRMKSDLRALGEEFFLEERKHSATFERYISTFAAHLGLELTELLSLLPTYAGNSLAARLMKLNAWIGGSAIWWLVMLTEEDSIQIYRHLRKNSSDVDPLYLRMHKLHYLDEVRHMSYAPMMIGFLKEHSTKMQRIIQRWDFIFMYLIHFFWIARQILRIRKITALGHKNEFFGKINAIYLRIRSLPLLQLCRLLAADLPWISQQLTPLRHQSIRSEINRSNSAGRWFVRWSHRLFLKQPSQDCRGIT